MKKVALITGVNGQDGAYLEMKHDSSSPADNDQLGIIQFKGKNSSDHDHTYGYIMCRSLDVTDGTEDGWIYFANKSLHKDYFDYFGLIVRYNTKMLP